MMSLPYSSDKGPHISGYRAQRSERPSWYDLQLTPRAYASTNIERDMFSKTEPGGIFKSSEMEGRAGEEIEDATGLKTARLAQQWELQEGVTRTL